MPKLIVVEKPENWKLSLTDVEVITPNAYITSDMYQNVRNIKVLNLCKSYQYQSEGYYVSLLAEARGHKVLPGVSTIQDFRFPSIIRYDSQDFDDLTQSTFKNTPEDRVEFNVYFGDTSNEHFNKLGKQLFQLVQAPFLRAVFSKKTKWVLQSLRPPSIGELPPEDKLLFLGALEKYFLRKRDYRPDKKKYDLAILINPEDNNPPSDDRALKKFYRAALETGFNVEFITKNDFDQLIQYDALFIRETTNVNHHSFRFAKKAASLGLVVIDDPVSILKCTNKVYLHELLTANKILTPKANVITEDNCDALPDKMGFPFILKQPDGAFSKGVHKITDLEQFKKVRKSMFEKSDLLIAQEFLPTPFDWRVGIIDGQVLYVCKYFMASQHWQIVNWSAKKEDSKEGDFESFSVDQAPSGLLKTALKATSLIGRGLYGVDMKEVDGKFYVIEINDNPNIDAGVEDKALKEKLYTAIMEVFLNRIKAEK
ncbi:MAG: RimK family protein [Cyclobacteriaceae bacterium]|nr:RimK family protein [Cyclobacteriaceae bacterium]MCB0498298.1 RimK family protein [Cyclobacteriaceae bacterium]MCB9239022.1 RimK family protein [Flammeovirgaceae bacterium]MCO5270744.1 RimK family protein [Cyclobacteriaceae bacterium]MCW5903518.1 RimK family protein [Cyclobacteriaceae bacterium]